MSMASGRLNRFVHLARWKPHLPERFKGGRIEKLVGVFKAMVDDYKAVGADVFDGMKKKPVKAALYTSFIGSIGVCLKMNPNEQHFTATLVESSIDLLEVSDTIRNQKSNSFIQELSEAHKDERLHFLNLGVCTLLWSKAFGRHVDLYEAKCNKVNPHWTEFHKQIIDVGVLGRWINLNKAMKDYDVSDDEWTELGMPKTPIVFVN